MAITKVNNVFSGYALDDFDETKNYHRVLFKPGVSVQARELTQMQTALQKQLDYHGQYSFVDGSRVIGGKVSLDVNYDFIQIEDVFQSSVSGSSVRYTASSYLDELKGTTLTGGVSGLKAKVLQVITAGGVDANDSTKNGILDSGTSDAITVYVKYIRSDATGDADTAADTIFTAGEVLTQSGGSSTRYTKVAGLTSAAATSTEYVGTVAGADSSDNGNGGSAVSAADATGTGSIAYLEEGSYFINGTFVYVAGQSVILNKYTATPSFLVGLSIVESVVASTTDSSLVDNASGYPNVSAPGADRYKILATLVKTEDDATPNSTYANFIQLLKITNGIAQINNSDTTGNTELTDRLARRTSEESGDYSIKPFRFDIREHLDTGLNGGLYTSGNSGSATKIVVGVEPNTAYVSGYRYENIATRYLNVDKPRTHTTKKSINFQLPIGNYVKATLSTVRGVPDVNNHTLATLQTGSDAADGICHFSGATNLTVSDRTERTIIVTEGVTAGVTVSTGTNAAGSTGLKLRLTTDAAGSTTVEVVEAGSGYAADTVITITNDAAALGGSGASIVLSGATLGIGTCRIRDLTFESVTLARIYLYDIKINGSVAAENSFGDVARIHQLDATSNADQFEATLSTTGTLFGTQNNSLIFPLPYNAIKDVASTTKPIYQIRKKFQADIANGTNTHSFSIGATESVIVSDAYLSQGTARPFLLPGDGVEITYDSTNNQIDLEGLDGNKHIELICTIQRSGATSVRKTKTYTTPAEATIEFDGTNKVPLGKADVKTILSLYNVDKRVTFDTVASGTAVGTAGGATIKLASDTITTIKVGMTVSLESGNTGTAAPTIYGKVLSVNNTTDVVTLDRAIPTLPGNGVNINFDVDVSGNFQLDTGQRDNFYDEATLIPIGTQAAITLGVKYAYCLHSAGDYFTAESYLSQYDTIPVYQSGNGPINLRDAMDFRPLKAVAGSITPGKEFTTGAGAVLTPMPKPDSNVIADIDYYLPRVDKIILDRGGDYSTITGTPAEYPQAPNDISDSMTVATLELGAYMSNIDEQQVYPYKHKRYTMNDIGKLDKRIQTLEYYTSLNFLENQAATEYMADGNNGQRFKNGIFVDSFKGHQNAFTAHPDYQISIDKETGSIRPHTNVQNVALQRYANDIETTGTKPMSSTIVENNSVYTLPFSHSALITQPYASYAEKVNPYSIFTWGGICELSPDSDEWKDTEHRPDVVIDNEGVYNSLLDSINESGVLGTIWGEWETNWTGSTTIGGNWGWLGRTFKPNWQQVSVNSGTGRWLRERTFARGDIITSRQSRTGLRNDIVIDTELETIDDKIVETSFIPFIRSRKIYFNAQLMKPNTKVYAFFNGTTVANFVREENFVEWTARGDSAPTQYTDDVAHHDGAGALITDDTGKVTGSFVIPNNSAQRFKTGTRQFRLSDSVTNDTNAETTFASADYHAVGILETRQKSILSTRRPSVATTELRDNRVIEDRSGLQTRTVTDWVDPLAQTFLIDQPGGLFITKLDIFVATEDASIPLRVSIREVENGIPTQKIVPGTDQIIYPGAVTTDADDGSEATAITFDYPVYLSERSEYAIVLLASTDNYRVWVAEQGKNDAQNPTYRINKQPYNGVFFTSQNASTWTPEQNKDLKFTLYRANFTTHAGSSATNIKNRTVNFVNSPMSIIKLPNNPLTYVSNSTHTVIRVNHPNHGMYCGPQAGDASHQNKVTIAGFVNGDNGLAASVVNAVHDVHDIELDSYCITIDNDAATTTGITGGGSAITAIGQIQYDSLYIYNESLQVPGTSIKTTLEGQTGKSVDGVDTVRGQAMNYTKVSGLDVVSNATNHFDFPMVIASAANEAIRTTDSSFLSKSMGVSVEFNSTSSYLSPVIDGTRCSVFAVQNRTNDATGHESALPTGVAGLNNQSDNYSDSAAGRTFVANTAPVGTSDANSYISKIVTLADAAAIMKVHATAARPAGSNIYLYYKALTPEQSDIDFNTIDWIYAAPSVAIPLTDSGSTSEVDWDITPTNAFTYFVFKIVLTSTDSANVPTVSAFRAIAAT